MPNGFGIEVSLDPRLHAGDRVERPRVDDLLRRLPNFGEIANNGRLALIGVGGLPVEHCLVHSTSVQVGVDRPRQLVDEGVHLVVGASSSGHPFEPALSLFHIPVESGDRRADEMRQTNASASQSSGRAAKSRLACLYHPMPESGCFHLPLISFEALS